MCFAVNKGSRKLFLNGFAGGTSVFICGLPSPSPPLFEVVRNQRAGVPLLPPPAWIPFGGGEAGAWGEPHHGLASCLPGSACVLLAQVDIPLNPSWVPWPRRAGRNSLGILGVLCRPAFLPAGLWQGGLLDTWLDATLHTPS